MDQATVNKLEEVYSLGGTDKEAIFYAGISHQTLYNYQEKNPHFVERKESLKQNPVLKARRTIVRSLEDDVNSAWRMVERKDPDLNPKQVIDHQSKGDKIEGISERLQSLADSLLVLQSSHEERSTDDTGAV